MFITGFGYTKAWVLCGFLWVVVLVACSAAPCRTRAAAAAGRSVLTDAVGHQAAVPAEVKRIGCLYAFTGHVTAMLGRADAVVAVSNGLRRDVLLTDMYPAFQRALVPKFQGAINIEELVKTEPDIVFIAAETARNDAERAKLDAFGLTWLAVGFHSMDEQQQAVRLIGAALGRSDRAQAYIDYYQSCIRRVRQAVRDIAPDKRIRLYHTTNEPTRIATKNSLPADWMRVAGVVNVGLSQQGRLLEGRQHVGIEQVLVWNPDVIVANEPGVADHIMGNPQWSSVAAVQGRRVYQMPIGISRWGHPGSLETPLAVLWTAKTVYPQQLADVDIRAEMRYFYTTFFSYNLSEDMIEHIVSGRGMRLTKSRKRRQD